MPPIVRPDPDAALREVRQVLRQVQTSLDAAAANVRSDVEAALDDILASRLLAATLLLKLDTVADTAATEDSGTVQSVQ